MVQALLSGNLSEIKRVFLDKQMAICILRTAEVIRRYSSRFVSCSRASNTFLASHDTNKTKNIYTSQIYTVQRFNLTAWVYNINMLNIQFTFIILKNVHSVPKWQYSRVFADGKVSYISNQQCRIYCTSVSVMSMELV